MKAIIFDLWDTLADLDRNTLNKIYEKLSDKLGHNKWQEIQNEFYTWHTVYEEPTVFLKRIISNYQLNEEQAELCEKWLYNENFRLYPEVNEIISKLANTYKLAIITNAAPTSVGFLEQSGIIEYFDVITYSFEVGVLKPDKKIFIDTAQKLEVDCEECLMIGDSLEKDVQGALHVDMQALLLDRKDNIDYKSKITDLRELPLYLDRINN